MQAESERLLNYLSFILNLPRNNEGKPCKWFIGFETLYRYYRQTIRQWEKGLEESEKVGKNFHILTFNGEFDINNMVHSFEQWGIEKRKELKHGRDYLYLQFKAKQDNDVSSTKINIHFLIRNGKSCYCYLPDEEKYTFCEIPANYVKKEPEMITWPGTSRTIKIPVMKGALLEWWYPLFFVPGGKHDGIDNSHKIRVKDVGKLF